MRPYKVAPLASPQHHNLTPTRGLGVMGLQAVPGDMGNVPVIPLEGTNVHQRPRLFVGSLSRHTNDVNKPWRRYLVWATLALAGGLLAASTLWPALADAAVSDTFPAWPGVRHLPPLLPGQPMAGRLVATWGPVFYMRAPRRGPTP